MKFTRFLLAFLMLPMTMLATDTSLVVELTNGQTANYLLQDKPTLTMDGTQLKIATATVQASYERAEVKRFYFTTESTSVNEIVKNAMVYRQIDANHLEISGLSGDERITVCDMAGRTVGAISQTNGTALISLNRHPSGVYLIKVGNSQTIKFIKK